MVLELRVPHGADLEALRPLLPVFLTYVLSYIYLGIYWSNHHHMLQATERISGPVLWANLHLLFWLSLIPFVTGWMGDNHYAPLPVAVYGVVMVMAAAAYTILQNAILACQSANSRLHRALGRDWKGKISLALYLAAIPVAFVAHRISIGVYVFVALMWLVPDRRIESQIER